MYKNVEKKVQFIKLPKFPSRVFVVNWLSFISEASRGNY